MLQGGQGRTEPARLPAGSRIPSDSAARIQIEKKFKPNNVQPAPERNHNQSQMSDSFSARFSRLEGYMVTLSSQFFQMQSVTMASMVELKDAVTALSLDREGALVSVANPKLCTFCDTGIRKCTPTASLRHMIKCEHCSESTCRHLAISEHLFSFKMAPLVGRPDCCCWCGIPWNECGKVDETGLSQSLSPDARSKHKKLCHTTVHESLQSTDPEIVLKAKTSLDRIWKESHPIAAYDGQKRGRSCGLLLGAA